MIPNITELRIDRDRSTIHFELKTVGRPSEDHCQWLQITLDGKDPAGYGFYGFKQTQMHRHNDPSQRLVDVWVTTWECSTSCE